MESVFRDAPSRAPGEKQAGRFIPRKRGRSALFFHSSIEFPRKFLYNGAEPRIAKEEKRMSMRMGGPMGRGFMTEEETDNRPKGTGALL